MAVTGIRHHRFGSGFLGSGYVDAQLAGRSTGRAVFGIGYPRAVVNLHQHVIEVNLGLHEFLPHQLKSAVVLVGLNIYIRLACNMSQRCFLIACRIFENYGPLAVAEVNIATAFGRAVAERELTRVGAIFQIGAVIRVLAVAFVE
ncbi:MAG TPA: hypothetical protein VH640_04540 [Bryobacteraceae bacterium]